MPIVETPDLFEGRPHLDGHRVEVESILSAFEFGATVEELCTDTYPSLSEDDVVDAIEWLRSNPGQVYDFRLQSIISTEKQKRQQIHPPLSLRVDGSTFLSMESDDSQDIVMNPSGRFLRIYYDLHIYESYAVYTIDLDGDVAEPIETEPCLTLGDAIRVARETARDEYIYIGDEVVDTRSVQLSDVESFLPDV